MNNIREIDTQTLSKYVNLFRQVLLKNGFFEHILYSTISYKIENADLFGASVFRLKDNLFLRYGTEPDVWKIGEGFDRFFWIGSLFRDEKTLTIIHNYEFKVLDFYIKNASMQDAIDIFLKLLNEVEGTLRIDKLSKLNVNYISYEDFRKNKFVNDGNYWLVVMNYPKEESFYDTSFGNLTNKFEIMFVNPTQVMEVASGGVVGKNLNKKMYVRNDEDLVNNKVFGEKFVGLGFGIERLIYLYDLLPGLKAGASCAASA